MPRRNINLNADPFQPPPGDDEDDENELLAPRRWDFNARSAMAQAPAQAQAPDPQDIDKQTLLELGVRGRSEEPDPTAVVPPAEPEAAPEQQQGLMSQWQGWADSSPNNSAFLINMGLALMQPMEAGQTPMGHIARAIGHAGSAQGEAEKQDIARAAAQRRAVMDELRMEKMMQKAGRGGGRGRRRGGGADDTYLYDPSGIDTRGVSSEGGTVDSTDVSSAARRASAEAGPEDIPPLADSLATEEAAPLPPTDPRRGVPTQQEEDEWAGRVLRDDKYLAPSTLPPRPERFEYNRRAEGPEAPPLAESLDGTTDISAAARRATPAPVAPAEDDPSKYFAAPYKPPPNAVRGGQITPTAPPAPPPGQRPGQPPSPNPQLRAAIPLSTLISQGRAQKTAEAKDLDKAVERNYKQVIEHLKAGSLGTGEPDPALDRFKGMQHDDIADVIRQEIMAKREARRNPPPPPPVPGTQMPPWQSGGIERPKPPVPEKQTDNRPFLQRWFGGDPQTPTPPQAPGMPAVPPKYIPDPYVAGNKRLVPGTGLAAGPTPEPGTRGPDLPPPPPTPQATPVSTKQKINPADPIGHVEKGVIFEKGGKLYEKTGTNTEGNSEVKFIGFAPTKPRQSRRRR